ncbi:MAG TPA: JAB domain-containing protein [Allosphingosinicella sp.]
MEEVPRAAAGAAWQMGWAVETQEPFAEYVRSPDDARRLLGPCFREAEAEKVVILHLNGERRLLALREYPGSADAADFPLRAVIEEALRLGSAELIVAHNHPSGDPQPSDADLRTSRLLAETARNLGMRLIDHLIFAGDDVRSMRDLGLL